MKKIILVAVAENGCIGKDNALPWRHPADLRMFKRETTGHAVIMGRKTFDSIRKPLPNRFNIVVSRSARESTDSSLEYVTSLQEACERAASHDKAFIVGGAEIYRLALADADEVWWTRIPGRYDGDTFFPEFPLAAHWNLYVEQHEDDVTFLRYRRA